MSGLVFVLLSTPFFQYSMNQNSKLNRCKAARRLLDLDTTKPPVEASIFSSSPTMQCASTSSISSGQAPAASTMQSPQSQTSLMTADTQKEMALWEALKNSNSNVALNLIAQGATLNLQNELGDQSFISLCVDNKLTDVLTTVLNNDAYYLKLYDLVAALIKTAHSLINNNVYYLQELLRLGLDPNKHPKGKKTLLSIAIDACKKYPNNVKIQTIMGLLVQAGASADIFVQNNSLEKIAIALQHRIDPTPLLTSALNRFNEKKDKSIIPMIELLLRAGASIADYVKKNNIEAVAFLIKHGADLSHPSNERLLHSAALRNNHPLVDLLLTKVDLTKADTKYEQTAIYAVALYGNIPMVQKLLKAGVPPFKKGSLEEQLLTAVQQNNPNKVRELLTQNDTTSRIVDHNIITPQGEHILSIALRNNIDIAIDLLDYGASLMYLVASDNVHDVEALLATYHADPNEQHANNVSLLTKAIEVAKQTRNLKMVSILLYYGAEIQPVIFNGQSIADIETIEMLLIARASSLSLNRDNQGTLEQLLKRAIASNNEALVKLLISYGIPIDDLIIDSNIDPNTLEKLIRLGAQMSEPNKWHQKNTPLQLAVANNGSGTRNKVTELILQATMSIDRNLINAQNKSQQTALHIAASLGNAHDTEMLLRAGASDEIYDCQGYLPIHELIITNVSDQNRLQVARMLITYGRAGINARTKNGATVLHLATTLESTNILDYLLTNFSQLRDAVDKNGNTALHYVAQRDASFGNTPEFVEHLVNEGLNVNAQNIHGDTPLIYAVRHGNIEVIQSLLNANADPTIANGFGESAVTIAQRYGHAEIIDLIQNVLVVRLARANTQQIQCHCISTCAQ